MSQFGKLQLVGLNRSLDSGTKSYLSQVTAGLRRDSLLSRARYLARVNYAYNYIYWLRRRSNEPGFIARAGEIEKRLYAPFARSRIGKTERAKSFLDNDYHLEQAMIAPNDVQMLRDDIFADEHYYDPYVDGSDYRGKPEDIRQPMLYMQSERLFKNPHFLNICANENLISFCKEVLGSAAALSWAWAWISNPGFHPYQNQNWHRDSSEPLNFIRVFVPLSPIRDEIDGPTMLIPSTSRHRDFYETRRYTDSELSDLQATNGVGMIPAEPGDVYFVNTFALHRGEAPMRRRTILTMVVSLSPSHRTPAISKIRFKDLPESVQSSVSRNRRFFRHLIA